MPREAREKSSTGIYHIMLRGINKQIIFNEQEDYQRFLDTIVKLKKRSNFYLYAYCFMNNHVHMLMKEGDEQLGIFFRRLGASYVHWYNWKYKRTGHLFQDRYKSEPVENDSYLMTVLRYIHQNPVKAGLVQRIDDYQWSSYNEYMKKPHICSTSFVLDSLLSCERNDMTPFINLHKEDSIEPCLEFNNQKRLNDTEAAEIIRALTGMDNVLEIQSCSKEKKQTIIGELRNQGLSVRQISRLTGVTINQVKVIKQA